MMKPEFDAHLLLRANAATGLIRAEEMAMGTAVSLQCQPRASQE
jgi:hypothetical protein